MRIGFDARILNSRRRTGIGVYAHNLVSSLASLYTDERFYLIYPSLGRREMSDWGYEAFPRLYLKGAMVPDSVREDRFYKLWLDIYLPLTIRRMRLDIFHGPANLVPSKGGAKKVVTVHDLSFIVAPEAAFDRSRPFLERFEKGVTAADAVIADSACTKRDLVRHCGVNAGKVTVIHLGVDPRFRVVEDEASRARWRSELGLPRDFILGPPSLHPRKNCLNLIRAYAVARKKGCCHALVLPGKDYGRNECYRLVDELGLQKHVLFPGYVDDNELVAMFNLAPVFVYPSLYEGFGLPLLEAMSCGCAVITSERGSIPEVVGDAAFYADPDRIEEIAGAIVLLLNDKALMESLRRKGLERVGRFSWERCARETHNVYDKLLDNSYGHFITAQ